MLEETMRLIAVMALLLIFSACVAREKSTTTDALGSDESIGQSKVQESAKVQESPKHPQRARPERPHASKPAGAPRTEATARAAQSNEPRPSDVPNTTLMEHHDTPDRSDQVREARVTPLDQSEAEDDVETTRKIRQALMRDDALSFRAKNVTVVTNMGHVTLRGPVKTREEADRIKEIARSVTGRDIEDRLQISE